MILLLLIGLGAVPLTVGGEADGRAWYASLRGQWDREVRAYADYMTYDEDDLNVADSHPEWSDARPAFRTRLCAVG